MSVVVEQQEGRRLRVASADCETYVDGSPESSGSFRSVDLLLGSLGSCMVGTMLSAAESRGIEVSNVRVELRPMVTLRPERVSRIRMKMSFGGDLSEDDLAFLKDAAERCKVHNSLHAGIETTLQLEHLPATEGVS